MNWIDYQKEKPKDGERVLIAYLNKSVDYVWRWSVALAWYDEKNDCFHRDQHTVLSADRWMPIHLPRMTQEEKRLSDLAVKCGHEERMAKIEQKHKDAVEKEKLRMAQFKKEIE